MTKPLEDVAASCFPARLRQELLRKAHRSPIFGQANSDIRGSVSEAKFSPAASLAIMVGSSLALWTVIIASAVWLIEKVMSIV